MGISDSFMDVVVDVLLDPDSEGNPNSLQYFDEFIAALSTDSGLPKREVQSRLVEKMLQDPRHTIMNDNIIQFDDYKHLLQVN